MAEPATSAPSSLSMLIACLKKAGVDWDGENIADLLWLVNHIDAPVRREALPDEEEAEQGSVRTEVDDRAPAPLPEMSPALTLSVPQPEQAQQEAAQRSRQGIPFQTPTAPALRKTLPLARSLRPLMRKVDSYTQQVLDETATAEQTAQQQFCVPVMRPARERWLDLALVIEDSASSFLWRAVIQDFQQVLERQGAFRTVTAWYLQTAAGGEIKLFAQRPKGEAMPRACSPKELLEASGRRLIFLISDCISPAWRSQKLHADYLELWAQHGPLAIVQMLPARLWRRTALAEGLKVPLMARFPGASNRQLISPAIAPTNASTEPGLKLPVITLEPAGVSQWARMLAGFGDTPATGVWFEAGWLEEMQVAFADAVAEPASDEAEGLAEQLVSRFSTTASDTARELAALMVLVPVDLPLVYIIQAKLLPGSTPLHVAEVFLSGLVERIHDEAEEKASAGGGSFFATQRRYDFVPGVRDILLGTVGLSAAEKALSEISAYICERLGKSSRSFMALLRLKGELAAEGEEFAEFARVTKQALRRLGGEYAEWVEEIEQTETPRQGGSTRRIEFPPLEVLEFSKGELVDSAITEDFESDANIEAFPPPLLTKAFTIATLVHSSQLPESTSHLPMDIDSDSVREIYIDLLRQYENDNLSRLKDLIMDALSRKFEDFDVQAESSSGFMYEQDYAEVNVDDFAFQASGSNDSNLFEITTFDRESLTVTSKLTVNANIEFTFSFSVYDSIDRDEVPMGSGTASSDVDIDVDIKVYFASELDERYIEVDWIDVEIERMPTIDVGEVEPDW